MRSFLFVNPPLVLDEDFIDYPYFANHGLLAGAALSARHGATVRVHDAFALPESGRHRRSAGGHYLGVSPDLFEASLPAERFDAVIVGTPVFARIEAPHPETVQLIATIRDHYPDAAVVLSDGYVGGQHYFEYDGEAVLAALPGVDAILKYPGERNLAVPERIASLRGARQVIDRDLGGGEDPLGPIPLFEGIDLTNFDRFLARCFRDGSWENTFRIGPGTRSFCTSIGCPHRCIFCTSNPGWRRTGRKLYQPVPLQRLKDWAYLLRHVYGAQKLFILDEMANVRPDFADLLTALNELGLTYEFPNGLRADHLTPAALDALVGHISVLSLSAESASQNDLNGPIGKGQPLSAIETAAAGAHQRGIPLMIHYIIGFPWETPADITATLDFAWDLYDRYRAWPSMQFATPIRGTQLHEQCVEMGLVAPEGLDLKDGALFQHRPSFDPPGCPPGYVASARAAFDLKVSSEQARKLIMNITYKCANRCVFCATGDRINASLEWPRIEDLLRRHRSAGTEHLDIDGGEPTLHPQLFDAVRLARDLGYRSVNVTSNGRLLRDASLAEGLVESGITHLLISLHGATAAVHDAATDAPGSFEQTLEGIREVMRAKPSSLPVGANVTITECNVRELGPLTELAIAEGFYKINFQFITPFGRAYERVVPPTEEAARAVMRVIDEYADRIEIAVINAQFCFFPGYERYVAADLQKLGRTMVFAADPRFPEEVNLYDWLGGKREKREECATCPWTTVCEGFQVFRTDKPDMRVERARPVVAA